MFMTSNNNTHNSNQIEIITSVQRRRRWTIQEKIAITEEAENPAVTVSSIAHKHGISLSQLFAWRRLAEEDKFSVVKAGKEVVPASVKPRDIILFLLRGIGQFNLVGVFFWLFLLPFLLTYFHCTGDVFQSIRERTLHVPGCISIFKLVLIVENM